MNHLTHKLFILALGLLTFTALFADSPSYEENLPETWYTLPEDSNSRELAQPYTELTDKQKQGIDRVFEAHSNAFSDFDSRTSDAPRGKWRLEACITDLALSASGVVGALVAKGDASVGLYWHRAEARKFELDDAPIDAAFDSDDSIRDIEKRLEPMVQAILATGHVKDEKALRKNLTDKVFDSHEIIQYLAQAPQASWKVSKLRVDLAIDVSGKVNPVTTVGGGVKIRLDWMLKSRSVLHVAKTRQQRKLGDNLKKIAQDLVQVLHEAKFEDSTSTGMRLKEIKLGLGIFGDGNVGVVKVGGSLFGYLYLVPNANYDEATSRYVPIRVTQIPVIDYTNEEHWQVWAGQHSVPYETYLSRDGERVIVYSALSDLFKKGLEKSNRMGNRFVERAAKHHGRWEIYQLKTEFSLSLSGDLGLFKLGGTGTIELVFA